MHNYIFLYILILANHKDFFIKHRFDNTFHEYTTYRDAIIPEEGNL